MKKLLFSLLFVSAIAVGASPMIWNSGEYGSLLSSLGFKLNDGKIVRSLTVDPTAGAGIVAPIGSIGLRDNSGAGEGWFKYGSSDTAWTNFLTGSTGWGLLGNAGTNSSTNFLGTTDDIGLTFRTNNTSRGAISSTGEWTLGSPAAFGVANIGGTLNTTGWTSSSSGRLFTVTGTLTDTDQSGTITNRIASTFKVPTFASTNSVTATNGINVYIEGAPLAGTNTSITNPYALYVGSGHSYFVDTASFGVNSRTSRVTINPPTSVSGWTSSTTGRALSVAFATSTDTDQSGTIATRVQNSFAQPTWASTNSVAVTTGATLYIAGAPLAGTNTSISNAYSLYSAAGYTFIGDQMGVGTTSRSSRMNIAPLSSVSGWTSSATGRSFSVGAATSTDTDQSGTIATRVLNSLATPTLASTNAVTISNAANLYIQNSPQQGSNTTITNSWGLWLDDGNTRLDGNLLVGNSTSFNDTAAVAEFSAAATADGSTPAAFTLTNTLNSGAWTDGAQWATHRFRSQDASGMGAGTKAYIGAYVKDTLGASDGLVFAANNGSALTPNMFLTNVGLGLGSGLSTTVDPASLLHMDSGTATASNHKFTAGTTTGQSSTDGFDIGITTTGSAELRQRENLDTVFYTNNTERMRIKAAGTLNLLGFSTAGVVTNNSSGDLATSAVLGSTLGGTGVNNAGTLTYGSNNITFTTGGSTSLTLPTSGTLLADPMTTRGDIMVRNSSNVTARLAAGGAGKVLRSDGTDPTYQYPEFNLATKTSADTGYTLVANDNVILCNAASGAVTLNVTAAATLGSGKRFVVKKTDTSTNACTIDPNSTETIDGSSTTTLNTQYESLTFVSDGSNFQIVSRSFPSVWASYSPTSTWSSGVSSTTGLWKRIGDSAVFQVKLDISGGVTAATLKVDTPCTIDTAKLTGFSASKGLPAMGIGKAEHGGITYSLQSEYTSTTQVTITYQSALTGAESAVNSTSPVTWGSGDSLTFFSNPIPCSGWN